MIVDPDFLTHWRTQMLADALGGDPCAPLYVLRIWSHCQLRRAWRFAMPPAAIKALCKFPGDAMALEAALEASGFVKREGAEVEAVGWAEHNASLIAAWSNGTRGGRPRKGDGQPTGNPRVSDGNPVDDHGRSDKSRGEGIAPSELVDEAQASPTRRTITPTVPCPYQAIVDLYHEKLPTLPCVKLMQAGRQKALRDRWGWVLRSKKTSGERRAATAEAALAWFGDYFELAALNDFVMGRTQRSAEHAGWRGDLDYLLTDRGLKMVIEKTEAAA